MIKLPKICERSVTKLCFLTKIMLTNKEEAEPGHRHISHLYGLYPSSQIQMGETPELIEAARETLKRRLANGGGHTGWSRAWMICMYARLWDGEEKKYCTDDKNVLKLQ